MATAVPRRTAGPGRAGGEVHARLTAETAGGCGANTSVRRTGILNDRGVALEWRGTRVASATLMRATSVMTMLALLMTGPAAADTPPAQRGSPPDAPAPPVDSAPPAPDTPAPAPAAPTTPPTATGPTIIAGRVTDVLGRPVVNMRVYVTPARGQPVRSKTDAKGRYTVTVPAPGRYGVVIAIGKAHTFRSVDAKPGETTTLDIDIDIDIDGGEVIQIDAERRPKPTVRAKPQQDERKALPYSDEAVKRDAWARAWVLLDVDETGKVKRLKLLKRPGYSLEKICIDEAFKLTFEPARDANGYPMKTYVLWSMEWPSWGWLVQGNGTAMRRPQESYQLHAMNRNPTHNVIGRNAGAGANGAVPSGGMFSQPMPGLGAFPTSMSRVPCYGSGPLDLDLQNRAYRDCSLPDIANARGFTWITRESAPTAIAEMSVQNEKLIIEHRPGPRWPAYVGFGVSGGLAVTTVLSYRRFMKYQSRLEELAVLVESTMGDYGRQFAGREVAKVRILSLAATVAAVEGVVAWNRPGHFASPPTRRLRRSEIVEMSW